MTATTATPDTSAMNICVRRAVIVTLTLAACWPTVGPARAEETQPALVPEGEVVPPLPKVRTLGHSEAVNAISWSPGGSVLASASSDSAVRLWDVASGNELRTLTGHDGQALSVSFSPDGSLLASASSDATARLWDVASGKLLRTLGGHSGQVLSVSFSPDGRTLASASSDRTVRLWDVASGRPQRTLSGHSGQALSVSFSPDGTLLASASSDNTVRLWDVASGEVLRTLSGHSGWVRSVSFSPDGTFLASASNDNTVRLWDLASGNEPRILNGHGDWVWSVSFSPDGRVLASASDDKTVRLWDVASGHELRSLSVYGDPRFVSVSFSPNSEILAAASNDGALWLWEISSGNELRAQSGHRGQALSLSFSPDGSLLASASDDRTIRLWDVASGRELRVLSGHGGRISSVRFSPDGTLLASASDDETVRLWDVASGKELRPLRGHRDEVLSVCFSPDGTLLASASRDKTVRLWNVASGDELSLYGDQAMFISFSPDGSLLASASNDGTVRLWDVTSSNELRPLDGHRGAALSLSFRHDGKLLASASDDGTVRLWDLAAGNEVRTLNGHDGWVRSVSFSPDGELLASASDDGTVRVWDPTSGTTLRTLSTRGGGVRSVSFSPDGTLLASASGDGTVRLWDPSLRRAPRALNVRGGWVRSVRFSPDGTLLASASDDGTVRLWAPASGNELRTLSGHGGAVLSVSFNPDGTLLASASADKTIRLWEVASGSEQRVLRGHDGPVSSVSFSPDGKLLASVSDDDTMRVWDVAAGKVLSVRDGQGGSVSFGPTEGLLASASDDRVVRLWRSASGSESGALRGHDGRVTSVSMSPDGTLLASASDDRTVRVWEVASGNELRTLRGHDSEVLSVSFSPDGETLASASADRTVRLWDIASGSCRAVFQGYRHGGWTVRHATGRLYRADDGTQPRFVVYDDWNSAPRPLGPPKPEAGAAVIEASVDGTAVVRDGKKGALIRVRIENKGDAPAYWLHVAPHPRLLAGFTVVEQGFRSRLGPRSKVEIPIFVAYTHRITPATARRPAPFETRLPLQVTSAFTKPVEITVPVRVSSPLPRVRATKVLMNDAGDPSALQVTILNTGDLDPEGVRVAVSFMDTDSGEVLHDSDPQSIELPMATRPKAVPLSFNLPDAVLEHDGEVEVEVRIVGGIWPTHQWSSRHPLVLGWPWLYLALTLGLGLLLAAGLVYQVVFRDPVVLRLVREPEALYAIRVSAAPAIDRRLRRARRLKSLLVDLDISPERWRILSRRALSPAAVLAEVLRADIGSKAVLEHSITVYPIALPPLPIPIERETVLVDVRNDPPADLYDLLDMLIAERNLQGRYLLLLDRTRASDLVYKLAHAPLKLAVLDEHEVTAVALAQRPVEKLCQVIARTARLADISPYQTSGGLHRPEQFFGRTDEIARLDGRDARNHLLIGARQMGKSSLLKLLHARDPERILFVTSTGVDLDADLRRQNLPTLDALPAFPPRGGVPILLIDEADRLVANDRKRDYELCRRLRTMAEEGRCRFILAGFWELHHAAYLEHQSPLRNLADPISLGPLDERAACELATRPLTTLGLRWESEELVDELLARTGRRPNLIALACDAAIRTLPALGKRELGADELRAVLDMSDKSGKAVAQFFGDLGSLTGDPRACRVDRMVLCATADRDHFSLREVEQRIVAAGAQVPIEELRESIARLVLAYVIQKRAGTYVYPVPLAREFLLAETEGEPGEMLALEARDWNHSTG